MPRKSNFLLALAILSLGASFATGILGGSQKTLGLACGLFVGSLMLARAGTVLGGRE